MVAIDAAHHAVRGSNEGGFSLPELLIGALLALGLIGSSVTIFTSGIRSEPRISDRTAQIQQARTFAESVSRELRQGSTVQAANASQLSIITFVKRSTCAGTAAGPAIPCRVTYTCSAATCSRVVANPDGTGAGAPVQAVRGLADTDVFSYSPDAAAPTFLGIRLAMAAADGEDAITIEDGIALRNHVPAVAPEAQ